MTFTHLKGWQIHLIYSFHRLTILMFTSPNKFCIITTFALFTYNGAQIIKYKIRTVFYWCSLLELN